MLLNIRTIQNGGLIRLVADAPTILATDAAYFATIVGIMPAPDPLLPDNRPPFGIPRQQLARWARLALFFAALVIILIVMFAGVTAREPWLWSRLSP